MRPTEQLPRGAAVEPRDVMFMGNNREGTATVVDPRTCRPIRTTDTIPDRAERRPRSPPAPASFHLAVQVAIGEGNA